LSAHGWISNQLIDWIYIDMKDRPTFFLDAVNAWYPDGLAMRLIERLAMQFPRNGRNAQATILEQGK
jgi:hypothetical protein